MVHGLKYQNLRASAADLGRLLAEYLDPNPMPADLLVPVPLHKRRERERGYNQSELLARELSKRTGIPLETRVLRRTRNTPPQVSIEGHEERRRNIEGAFECAREVGGQKLLVVDDVVTTGSTMSACAGALKASGATSVWGLALARQT
jgi:ComF family protein